MIYHPLKPIIDKQSKVLILGSFPSILSRQELMYYANPQNRFWKVLSEVYQEQLVDRESFIIDHHLALWDVIESCEINKSADSSIHQVVPNKIEELLRAYPIELIVLNGKKAEELYKKYFKHIKIDVVCCPSTSSANAAYRLKDLIESYRVIRGIK